MNKSFVWSKKTDQFDIAGIESLEKIKGSGKNFKPLVEQGQWKISGFRYGRSKCQCCGRPITRLLLLKNEYHKNVIESNPNYSFPEEICIGVVCGPKVFAENARQFYDCPEAEWRRQFGIYKGFIDYVTDCYKNKDIWNMVPECIRSKIDSYLDENWKQEKTTYEWWRLRDAKRSFLKTKRNSNNIPSQWSLNWKYSQIIRVAQRCKILDTSLNKEDIELKQFSKTNINEE